MVSAGRDAFAPGDQVGAYTIIKQIGSGGMGEVFEAQHRHIGRGAAIKVLLPELSAVEAAVTRLFNEARAASLIKHPGIVEILDCDIHPATGRAYIVMELLQGENLGTCLRRVGSFRSNPQWVAAVTGQIAGALAAAHGKGITHRDLKPDNVFLASTPDTTAPLTVKVLDFGVAKLFAKGTGVATTGAGTILGTPHYMSPEQCRGVDRVDHRADIYSLGCMMFELIAGSPPFVGEGAGDLLVAHISKPPPDLAALVPEISPRMNDLVGRMLAKDPGQRPQQMEEVVRYMEAELAVSASSFSTLILPPDHPRVVLRGNLAPLEPTRVLAADDAELENTASGSRTTMTVRRRRAVISGLALGIGFGAAIFLAFRRGGDVPPTVSNRVPAGAFESQSAAPMTPQEPLRAPLAAPRPSPGSLNATVDLSSNPSGAEVWVPGESTPRGLTPVVLLLPRSAAPKQVVLKAPGYKPKTVSLVIAHDSTLAVQLDKLKTERKPSVPHRGKQASDDYAPMPD